MPAPADALPGAINVHTDIAPLEVLGLEQRSEGDTNGVRFEFIVNLVLLAQSA